MGNHRYFPMNMQLWPIKGATSRLNLDKRATSRSHPAPRLSGIYPSFSTFPLSCPFPLVFVFFPLRFPFPLLLLGRGRPFGWLVIARLPCGEVASRAYWSEVACRFRLGVAISRRHIQYRDVPEPRRQGSERVQRDWLFPRTSIGGCHRQQYRDITELSGETAKRCPRLGQFRCENKAVMAAQP